MFRRRWCALETATTVIARRALPTQLMAARHGRSVEDSPLALPAATMIRSPCRPTALVSFGRQTVRRQPTPQPTGPPRVQLGQRLRACLHKPRCALIGSRLTSITDSRLAYFTSALKVP